MRDLRDLKCLLLKDLWSLLRDLSLRRDLRNMRYLKDMWLHRLHQFFEGPLGLLGF